MSKTIILSNSFINRPKFSHVSPLFRDLYWPLVVARIRFKVMVLAQGGRWSCSCLPPRVSQTTHPSFSFSSTTSAGRLVPPSLRAIKDHQSPNSSVLAPQWWNELHRRLETHLVKVHRPRICIAPPSSTLMVSRTSWHLMHALIVCCTSWHVKIVLGIV